MRLKMILGMLMVTTAIGVVVFSATGSLALPMYWAYLGLLAGCVTFVAVRFDLDLLRERFKPAAASRDNLLLLRLAAAAIFLSHWVIAGLDVGRFHWSGVVPLSAQVAGLAAFVAGMFIWFWAMSVNRFFSSAVRIQSDRGHHVISTGPYRIVRHPGYASMCFLGIWSALALGSLWAMLPPLICSYLFIRRTIMEDRMLREELAGYAEYARRVPYRLMPGVW